MHPKLPNIPEKVKPNPYHMLVYPEPPMKDLKIPKGMTLSDQALKEIEEAYALESKRKIRQTTTMTRAIIMRLPEDMGEKYSHLKVGDLVGVPFAQYDMINVDRTPLLLVGLSDVKAVLPDLTEEEAAQWDKDQEVYINTMVYPELDSPSGSSVGPNGLILN